MARTLSSRTFKSSLARTPPISSLTRSSLASTPTCRLTRLAGRRRRQHGDVGLEALDLEVDKINLELRDVEQHVDVLARVWCLSAVVVRCRILGHDMPPCTVPLGAAFAQQEHHAPLGSPAPISENPLQAKFLEHIFQAVG